MSTKRTRTTLSRSRYLLLAPILKATLVRTQLPVLSGPSWHSMPRYPMPQSFLVRVDERSDELEPLPFSRITLRWPIRQRYIEANPRHTTANYRYSLWKYQKLPRSEAGAVSASAAFPFPAQRQLENRQWQSYD